MPNVNRFNTVYPALATSLNQWKYHPAKEALAKKNILVTGASDGIGLAMSKTFACYGANVLLLGKTRTKLEDAFDWIVTHTKTEPCIIPFDLERIDNDAVIKLVNLISGHYKTLHGLVNNASMLGPRVPIPHYPDKDWSRVFQINAIAPFVLTKGLFNLLDSNDDSCVINISSGVGQKGRAYWGAYSASKFAIEGFSQILADETEEANRIKVYCVNPGATRTKMRKEAYPLENADELSIPESYLDLFIALMEGNGCKFETPISGSRINAQEWNSPN